MDLFFHKTAPVRIQDVDNQPQKPKGYNWEFSLYGSHNITLFYSIQCIYYFIIYGEVAPSPTIACT